MKLFVFVFLFCLNVFATPGSPVLTSAGFVKTFLPLNISNQCYIITGTADPSSVAQNAPECSMYMSTNGNAYIKQDAGSSTNWSKIATGASAVTTVFGRSGAVVAVANDYTFSLIGGTATTSQLPVLAGNRTGILLPPSRQAFASGSGTYTAPTNPAPLYLRVRLVGGGGGSGGSGTSGGSGSNGTGGGLTFFGGTAISAGGGSGGAIYNQGNGGPGGSATNPSGGASGFCTNGAIGSAGFDATISTVDFPGGMGASTPFGGGSGGGTSTGMAAPLNTGAGGGGAGLGGLSNGATGGGGGAGAYCDAFIINPATTYTYGVGAAGAGGSAAGSGFAGASGGNGYLEVTEYYQ